MERRSINYEKLFLQSTWKKLLRLTATSFILNIIKKLLIVNNENLDIIDDPGAISMLVEKIDQLSSTREFFNPRVI